MNVSMHMLLSLLHSGSGPNLRALPTPDQSVANAIAIGFLADVRPDRVVKVGNASIRGARRLLLSRRRRETLERLVRRIEHVELETTPDFFELFVDACQFKPFAA